MFKWNSDECLQFFHGYCVPLAQVRQGWAIMGHPASTFVRPLSQADQQYLHTLWREHKVHTVRSRGHAILLSSQGYTILQIRDVFGISTPTALTWIERWESHGREGLEDESRSGGPASVNEEKAETFGELLHELPRQPKRVIQALARRKRQAK